MVLVMALIAGMGMVIYPLLPVTQHTATYHWDGETPAALPLSPYRPEQLIVSIDCSVPDGQVLETVRAVDEGMQAGRGTFIVDGDMLHLTLRGDTMQAPVPGDCTTLVVDITTTAVTVTADGETVFTQAGDHRPAMDSLTSDPGVQGVSATVIADTQWDSSPTPVKVAVGTVSAALLAVALVLVTRGDRPRRAWQRPRGRVRPEDGVVLGAVGFGVLFGGATDDDGFIAQIIQTPSMSGYVGNYVRWNNAPEAPFGWFYEIYARWGAISMEPVWLRLLPAVLALAAWVVLRHGLVPCLVPALRAEVRADSLPKNYLRDSKLDSASNGPVGGFSGTAAPRIALTSGFTLLWLVFANSLRPEIFFALGSGIVVWCVVDALHRRALWPLLIGALVAGLTVGTGPTGLVAIAPFVVAGPRLWRWLAPTPLRGLAVATTWLASLGAIVLLMFADQTLMSVASSNTARTQFGPIYAFWEDYQRYWKLWWSFAARQFSVYLSAVALAWLLWQLRRPRLSGINKAVAAQVTGGAIALVVVMVLGPTKLPHHFGALLLFGPLAMAAAAWRITQRPAQPRATGFLLGGSVAVVGLALHHNNAWWKLSTLGLLLDKNPLTLGLVPLWPFLVLGGLLVGVWFGRGRGLRPARTAVAYALGLAVLSGLQYANFAQAALVRGPERYTMASAAVAAITGEGCKLERSLHYEPDPTRGVLPAPEGDYPFTQPALADRRLPAETAGLLMWVADPATETTMTTGWYSLPEDVRNGRWPLVIAASGIDDEHRVIVEYDDQTRHTLTPTRKTLGTSELSDIRLHPAPTVTQFRVIAESDGPVTPDPDQSPPQFAVAQPRVPVTEPLLELAHQDTVAVAWNLAFFAPCLATPHQGHARVEIADYILSDSEQPGNMSYHSRSGGPFAGVLGLTTPSRVPLYAAGDYSEADMSALDLVRLIPGDAVGVPLAVELGTRGRNGWDTVPAVP